MEIYGIIIQHLVVNEGTESRVREHFLTKADNYMAAEKHATQYSEEYGLRAFEILKVIKTNVTRVFENEKFSKFFVGKVLQYITKDNGGKKKSILTWIIQQDDMIKAHEELSKYAKEICPEDFEIRSVSESKYLEII